MKTRIYATPAVKGLNDLISRKVTLIYFFTYLLFFFLRAAQFVGRCTFRNVSSSRSTSKCHVLGGTILSPGEFLFSTQLLVQVDGFTMVPESSTAEGQKWSWGRDSHNFWCC